MKQRQLQLMSIKAHVPLVLRDQPIAVVYRQVLPTMHHLSCTFVKENV